MTLFCYIAGGICILYCFIVGVFVGHGTNFYLIWAVLGLILFLMGFLWKKGSPFRLPAWLRLGALLLLVMGIIFFLAIEGCILSGFFTKEERTEDFDYIIVLGAQMKENGPSRVLQMRLDTACDYLMEHEDTLVIVSGGQGADERESEAEGMRRYLEEKGIDPLRIIMEDQSRNTAQNIEYSSRFLDKTSDRVGIVSNNFHIFRALGLARHAGYADVSGIAAPSEFFLLPNNMFREFFGVVKDFVVGNL